MRLGCVGCVPPALLSLAVCHISTKEHSEAIDGEYDWDGLWFWTLRLETVRSRITDQHMLLSSTGLINISRLNVEGPQFFSFLTTFSYPKLTVGQSVIFHTLNDLWKMLFFCTNFCIVCPPPPPTPLPNTPTPPPPWLWIFLWVIWSLVC